MRTRQELKQRIAIQLKDKYDYTDILGVKCSCQPPEKPGRGLFNYNGEALEMQLIRFAPGLEQEERIQRLKAEVEALTLKIRVIGERESWQKSGRIRNMKSSWRALRQTGSRWDMR